MNVIQKIILIIGAVALIVNYAYAPRYFIVRDGIEIKYDKSAHSNVKLALHVDTGTFIGRSVIIIVISGVCFIFCKTKK